MNHFGGGTPRSTREGNLKEVLGDATDLGTQEPWRRDPNKQRLMQALKDAHEWLGKSENKEAINQPEPNYRGLLTIFTNAYQEMT